MNCSRCGAVITETQIYCPSCGMELPHKKIQPGLKRAYEPEKTSPGTVDGEQTTEEQE